MAAAKADVHLPRDLIVADLGPRPANITIVSDEAAVLRKEDKCVTLQARLVDNYNKTWQGGPSFTRSALSKSWYYPPMAP
jgi:hypothetical protein